MYKLVIRDYVRNFAKRRVDYGLLLSVIVMIVPLNAIWAAHESWRETNWMAGVPVILALFGGILHRISLAPMMYLVPLSKQQREDYLQKMLYVRLLAAVVFALLWDIAARCAGQLPLYNFLVQILCVVISAYTNATLSEGSQAGDQVRTAFGGLKSFVAMIRATCGIGMWTLGCVCMYEIGRIAFCVICGVLLVVFVPIVAVVHKHWPMIRANFADYELAFAVENIDQHW